MILIAIWIAVALVIFFNVESWVLAVAGASLAVGATWLIDRSDGCQN